MYGVQGIQDARSCSGQVKRRDWRYDVDEKPKIKKEKKKE